MLIDHHVFLRSMMSSLALAYHFAPQLQSSAMTVPATVNQELFHNGKFQSSSKDLRAPSNIFSNRRTALSRIALIATSITSPTLADETVGPQSIVKSRILSNSLLPPPYGMEATDIYYPAYFQGSWNVASKTTDIYAPCGLDFFPGRQSAYEKLTQNEVQGGDTLNYRARFVPQRSSEGNGINSIVADREYNAKEIAKAAMGSYSVVDVSVATPNRFSCVLAPSEGSGGSLIAVDILAIARKYESSSPEEFSCSEVVRQIVSPATRNNPNSPLIYPLSVKEVETITVYTVDRSVSDEDSTTKRIKCRQRTATFLVPSQTDPIAMKMWQMSSGQPVDVRYYDVIYSRI